MIGRKKPSISISLDNKELKQLSEFKYLEATCTYDGRMDNEIEIRCHKAKQVIWQLSPILKHYEVHMKTKKLFIKTYLYQLSAINVKHGHTHNHHRKLVTTEKKCLRRAT
jgi:hypothetical protein